MKKKILVCLASCLLVPMAMAKTSNFLATEAQLIGWVPDTHDPYNLCGGYYRELPIIYNPNALLTSQANNYDIHAGSVELSSQNTSRFTGGVHITQPGQEIQADQAEAHRDPQTHHLTYIDATGHVGYFAPGLLLVGDHIRLNLPHKTATLQNATYRSALSDLHDDTRVNAKTGQVELDRYQLNLWGHAKTIKQTSPKHFQLTHATFSTCSPSDYSWHIKAKEVNLNTEKGVGSAWNSLLYAGKVPIFYFPYVNFPLTHDRKSGFLSPIYEHSQRSGAYVGIPYYWNMAPNYDDMITPQYYFRRGAKVDDLFRFLTPHSNGAAEFDFLPRDRLFHEFQQVTPTESQYASRPEGLAVLAHDNDFRYQAKLRTDANLGDHWKAQVNYTQLSDDYYAEDLGAHLVDNATGQLLQRADVTYEDDHWGIEGLVQGYQTLHPVDQAINMNQYQRLPDLTAHGNYALPDGFDFMVSTEAVHFQESQTPDTNSGTPVNGQRISIDPTISYPWQSSSGYLVPRIQIQANQYQLQHAGQLPHTPSDSVPIMDVSSGLYFDRQMRWFGTNLTQTLEPELYYLYVPYHNQNNLPIFDTTTQNFDYNFLFLDNRFSGVDRIGDTSQVTYALTTRFLDGNTGIQQGSASIGQIAYFKNRRVVLCDNNQGNCQDTNPIDRESFSPMAGQFTLNTTRDTTVTGNLTWDPYQREFINHGVTFSYQPTADHVINLGYNFIRDGAVTFGGPGEYSPQNDLKQTNISAYWTVYQHWLLLGRWNYSWSNQMGNAYLFGLGYTTCCWSIRGTMSRTYQGQGINNQAVYNDAYDIEFVLSGLGGASTGDLSSLIDTNISIFMISLEKNSRK